MNSNSVRRSGVVACLVALSLVAAACSEDDKPTSTATPAPTSTSQEASASTSATQEASASVGATEAIASEPATSAPAAASSKGWVVGNSIAQGENEVLQAQTRGLHAEAKRYGFKVIDADANLNPSKQISDIDSFVQRKVNAIVIWPVDAKGVAPALDRAMKAGIHVVTRDNPGPGYINLANQEVKAGKEVADFFLKKFGKGAKVAAILGPEALTIFHERNKGFIDAAKENGLDVVDAQTNSKISPEGSGTFAQQWKTRFGSELKGIYDVVDLTALAAAAAVGGDFQPCVAGIGGGEQAIEAIKTGQLCASWDMVPIQIGRAEAWAVDQLAQGTKLPETIWLPMYPIDKSNVDQVKPFDVQVDEPLAFSIVEKGDGPYLDIKVG